MRDEAVELSVREVVLNKDGPCFVPSAVFKLAK